MYNTTHVQGFLFVWFLLLFNPYAGPHTRVIGKHIRGKKESKQIFERRMISFLTESAVRRVKDIRYELPSKLFHIWKQDSSYS